MEIMEKSKLVNYGKFSKLWKKGTEGHISLGKTST